MLHGEIKINGGVLGEWQAVRKGPMSPGSEWYIYQCHIKFEDERGYVGQRHFFVFHKPTDGALRLTSNVTQVAAIALDGPMHALSVVWDDFCTNYELNRYMFLD